jgi:hypothetical protein
LTLYYAIIGHFTVLLVLLEHHHWAQQAVLPQAG